jgi:ABC-type nitrate/sulfonate/bicarbonate transport system substrate-binding protein
MVGTLSVGLTSCGSDAPRTSAFAGPKVSANETFPAERCVANEAAGKITYLSSFDYAAAAGIVEVMVAKQKGYFDEMCLDVEVKASFSLTNLPLIASNQAQFSSGGSFSEVATFATENPGADVVVLAVEGRTAIDGLIIKEGKAVALADLRGKTIGVKGRITPSVQAMLAEASLNVDRDYKTVPVDGFDPLVHIAIPEIVGFPGYKSNEPGALDRAGIKYTLFDPTANGIPGSFGILYSNRAFMTAHPSAAEDFMRAAMKGLSDAIADPAAASRTAVDFLDNAGNPNFLSPESETFRWETEAALINATTPSDQSVGAPDAVGLTAEVTEYAKIGLFDGKAPDITKLFDASVLKGIYDAQNHVIWPKS